MARLRVTDCGDVIFSAGEDSQISEDGKISARGISYMVISDYKVVIFFHLGDHRSSPHLEACCLEANIF